MHPNNYILNIFSILSYSKYISTIHVRCYLVIKTYLINSKWSLINKTYLQSIKKFLFPRFLINKIIFFHTLITDLF